jgi:hypothetical protein
MPYAHAGYIGNRVMAAGTQYARGHTKIASPLALLCLD